MANPGKWRRARCSSLLTELGLHPQGTIVERNREIVDREIYRETRLAEGDVLELVRLVGGG